MTAFIIILFLLAAISLIAFIISMVIFLVTKFKKGKLKLSKWVPIGTIIAFAIFSALDIGIISKVSAEQNKSTDIKQEHKKKIFGIDEEIYSDESGNFKLKGHYKPNQTISISFLNTNKAIEKLDQETKCDNKGDFSFVLMYPKADIEDDKEQAYLIGTIVAHDRDNQQTITVHPSELFINEVLNESDETEKKEDDSKSVNSSDTKINSEESIENSSVESSPTPVISTENQAALESANSYANNQHMSKQGVYDQLTSQYGEKFPASAAQYAIDNVQADWDNNALEAAKSYRDNQSMSTEAIRDQLTSQYGEKFTLDEANYAIQHLND
ncbi:Ltp family lipoprotein [Melissococcus plutonius]|uniref:Ltp family lipoprotein n=1 Tax=Melissococcus plutonius TaxID=33970 RepID=UPI003C2C1C3F